MLFLIIVSMIMQLPSEYDLRNADGECLVTSIRTQTGGTCWAHGTLAAMESNLLLSGFWESSGETGEPDLAEYHLDWWNGFNSFWNPDLDPPYNGLIVHQGGDYLISAAYLTRGDGAVRDTDGQSFSDPPLFNSTLFHHYMPLSIAWITVGCDMESLNPLKEAIITGGAVATCMHSSSIFMSEDFIHYQPPSSTELPTHAVAIVGWNDTLSTQAPEPGAWLCRNSWGENWGLEGYFWISYWDKWTGRDSFMGAVSFTDVRLEPFTKTLFHDLHGWRDTCTDTDSAINAFSADEQCVLSMVSFYTAVDSVSFSIVLYASMKNAIPSGKICSLDGFILHRGLHTVELQDSIQLSTGDSVYVLLDLSRGGQPFDRTADVPVLLGSSMDVIVGSSASPGESFYLTEDGWLDFWYWDGNPFPGTGNFCIKLLGFWTGIHVFPQHAVQFAGNGEEDPFNPSSAQWTIVNSGSPVDYQVASEAEWLELSGTTSGVIHQGDSVVITATPVPFPQAANDTLLSASIQFNNLSDPLNSVTRFAFLKVTQLSLLYTWPLNVNPQWEMTDGWSWGIPEGQGGENGCPDPVSGHTGSTVLGYNLSGDYSSGIQEAAYAATEPFSCAGASDVQLRYRRWLGVNTGDTAGLVGSGDFGSSGWQPIWSNSNLQVFDSCWVSCTHNISGFADYSENVSVVWLMGPSNFSGSACGWNIDDIEIWGSTDGPGSCIVPDSVLMGEVFPNPAYNSASVYIQVATEGFLEVSVYDLSGRMVQSGYSGQAAPGLKMIYLDLSSLPAGWYGVRSRLSDQMSTASFIKL